jgi:hypothetical protein
MSSTIHMFLFMNPKNLMNTLIITRVMTLNMVKMLNYYFILKRGIKEPSQISK